MIRFRVKWDAATDPRGTIRSWKKKLRDLRWAWPEAFRAVEAHHLEVFNTEGADNAAGTGPWKPLHEITIRARLYGWIVSKVPPRDYAPDSGEGPESRILHWSHRLRSSMGTSGGLFMGDAIRRFNTKSMEYGTRTPYAADHQYGRRSAGGIIPPRPFLDDETGPEIVVSSVARQVYEMVGAA